VKTKYRLVVVNRLPCLLKEYIFKQDVLKSKLMKVHRANRTAALKLAVQLSVSPPSQRLPQLVPATVQQAVSAEFMQTAVPPAVKPAILQTASCAVGYVITASAGRATSLLSFKRRS
jgi:hypothetical protein